MSKAPKSEPKDRGRLGTWIFQDSTPDPIKCRKDVEPWLTALFQSEHLSLLLGSGFTIGIAQKAKTTATGMSVIDFAKYGVEKELADRLHIWSSESAKNSGRGSANIEDQIRAALQLQLGLDVLGDSRARQIKDALNKILSEFLTSVLQSERNIKDAFSKPEGQDAKDILISFLMSFASRTATRERLNLFTTNYDRLIEFGCDLAGLRTIDRFVGSLTPIFRSSRADVDLHYNPPGIRGEPRFLEGVVKLTKLHGSLDWSFENGQLQKPGIAFGASAEHPDIAKEPVDSVIIYPNPAKDVETSEYPYAELFRDLSAALCRPNSVLVTFGYGFGDDHINRVIRDMLTIPSTHLVVLAYGDSLGRIQKFIDEAGRSHQISFLMGPHFGSIENLVKFYLPKPAIDVVALRRADLLRKRQEILPTDASDAEGE